MSKRPYMPLLMGDWIKGTRGMRAEVKGVYIGLLIHQYDEGSIPDDVEEISLIEPEVKKVWDKLKDKFEPVGPGKLQNKKLEEVRAFWNKQSENGSNGGRPKGPAKQKYISPEKFDWEEMISFFKNACLACQYIFPEEERPTKDHIIPKIYGGIDHISNYQPLCRQCNSSKNANHSTDYRLKFIDNIPDDLKTKWFNKTQIKPKHETKLNHHNDIDLDNEFKIENDTDTENVIKILNEITGSSFRKNSDVSKRPIAARLNEGFTLKDFRQVIETKFYLWHNDPKMAPYLRPQTLFGSKFESYLEESKKYLNGTVTPHTSGQQTDKDRRRASRHAVANAVTDIENDQGNNP